MRRRSSRHVVALAVAATLGLGAASAPARAQGVTTPPADVDSVATRWLGMLAGGRYDDSWNAASSNFRARIGQPEWSRLAQSLEEQLTRPTQRRVIGSGYSDERTSTTPAEYALIRYQTDPDPRDTTKHVYEIVKVERPPGGAWQVSDYMLWPNPKGDVFLLRDRAGSADRGRPTPNPTPAPPVGRAAPSVPSRRP